MRLCLVLPQGLFCSLTCFLGHHRLLFKYCGLFQVVFQSRNLPLGIEPDMLIRGDGTITQEPEAIFACGIQVHTFLSNRPKDKTF